MPARPQAPRIWSGRAGDANPVLDGRRSVPVDLRRDAAPALGASEYMEQHEGAQTDASTVQTAPSAGGAG